MIDLRITLSKDDSKRLAQASDEAISAIRNILLQASLKIEREAKILIDRGRKTGHHYGKHQASAPGEAPATNTGRLIQSIDWQILNQGFTAEVGATAFYAPFLEDGTSQMAARPWIKPAYDKHSDDIVTDIMDVLKKFL